MAKKPCRLCSRLVVVSAKSRPEPTCHSCRRALREGKQPAPNRAEPTSPRQQPRNVASCALCNKKVYRSATSALRIVCRPCRKEHPQRADRSVECIKPCTRCGDMFTARQGRKLCVNCRLNRERNRGSANKRGYGHGHKLRRTAALAALEDGTPCPRCEMPMDHEQPLDLDHADDRSSYLGLSHAWCNRAKRGTAPGPPRRRPCVMCGATYVGKSRTQQCCSRRCGVELRA